MAAAQHPLKDGRFPDEEFEARLRRAAELAKHYRALGCEVEIYVPGSRHMYHGTPDMVSLATAGTKYLDHLNLGEGISIHGADLNLRYKGDQGVYNSADECFVAQYFKDGDFSLLLVVSSDVQVLRQKLHLLWQGVEALVYAEPVVGAYHSPVTEMFFQIPHTRDTDPSWQETDSELYIKSREERRPPRRYRLRRFLL
jgi:hypothetical protein